jgi:hypothetical protein
VVGPDVHFVKVLGVFFFFQFELIISKMGFKFVYLFSVTLTFQEPSIRPIDNPDAAKIYLNIGENGNQNKNPYRIFTQLKKKFF